MSNWKIKVVPAGMGFGIVDEQGEGFADRNNRLRWWDKESKAIGWLRGQARKYNADHSDQLTMTVTKVDGSQVQIGEILEREKYGQHDWRKVNLMTISDSHGLYDLLRCTYCGKETKRFGFEEPMGGICPKNPKVAT